MIHSAIFVGVKDDFGLNVRINLTDVVAYHNFSQQTKAGEDIKFYPARLHLREKGSVTLKYKTEEKAKGLISAIDDVLKKDNAIFFYE